MATESLLSKATVTAFIWDGTSFIDGQEMKANKASIADAINMYALAIAYLRSDKFDTDMVANTMRIVEVSPRVFYFWRRESLDRHKGGSTPDAVCTSNKTGNRWQVNLGKKEQLTLVDRGSVWELEPQKSIRQRTKGRSSSR